MSQRGNIGAHVSLPLSICAVNWRDIPPVGNRILLEASGELPTFTGYDLHWLQSGTASLALAMRTASVRAGVAGPPEVILPAYGCPDLVAAANHAGLRPVLADIGSEDPGYDLDALRAALSPRTVAVVAVNFLGIRERLEALREILQRSPQVTLIEDNAQWFPEHNDARLHGDAVVFSFGRGKPVSLLGGGALLMRNSMAASLGEAMATVMTTAAEGEVTAPPDARVRAYNLLRNPWLFPLASRNPLLKLGRTRYRPLDRVVPLDARRRELLPANIQHYRKGPGSTVWQAVDSLVDPSRSLAKRLAGRAGRLLRYPVLCAHARERDAWLARLRQEGLGASAMYERPLAQIEGVTITAGQCAGAAHFAARLLTLPVHEGVDARVLAGLNRALAP